MSNLPKIYAHCDAGCNWETVHRSEVGEWASQIVQKPSADGYYYLQRGKDYRIVAAKNSEGTEFACTLILRGEYGGVVNNVHDFDLPVTDKYAGAFVFRLLEEDFSNDAVIYEYAGIRQREYFNNGYSPEHYTPLSENQLALSSENVVAVYLLNSDMVITVTGEKGEKGDAGSVKCERINVLLCNEYISVDTKNGKLTIPATTELMTGDFHKNVPQDIEIPLVDLYSSSGSFVLYNKKTDNFTAYPYWGLSSLDLRDYCYLCSVRRYSAGYKWKESCDLSVPHLMNGELVGRSPDIPRAIIIAGGGYISINVDSANATVTIPANTNFVFKGFQKTLKNSITLDLYPLTSTAGNLIVYNKRTDEIMVAPEYALNATGSMEYEGFYCLFAITRKATSAVVDLSIPYYINGQLFGLDLSTSSDIGSSYEDYGLPILRLTGDVSAMSKDNEVTLQYNYARHIVDADGNSNEYVSNGSCAVKWQGSSSIYYPKKNYTIKFANAFEVGNGWGAQKKYCLKANWIDATHSRNLICAKLWGQMVKSRSNPISNIDKLPNGGAVDGFPCIVTINDQFAGLYTFNIPKDGWMYDMGGGDQEAILCADPDTNSGRIVSMRELADLDGDFEIEYVSNEDDTSWVLTSLNNLIDKVINSTTTLDDDIDSLLDWESAIDYYILVCLIGGYDMIYKNYLLSTYDGTKWFFGAYDMDSTFGLWWNGEYFIGIKDSHIPTFSSGSSSHNIFKLIYKFKKDELKQRYTELRNGVLNDDNVATVFANFIGQIPSEIYSMERKKWTAIPNTSANNLHQIVDWYSRNAARADAEINAL